MPRREPRILICEINRVEQTNNLSFTLVDPVIYKTIRDCRNVIRNQETHLKRFAIIQLLEVIKVETEIKKKLVVETIQTKSPGQPAPETGWPAGKEIIGNENSISSEQQPEERTEASGKSKPKHVKKSKQEKPIETRASGSCRRLANEVL